MKVVLASKNKHKLVEISKITEKFGIELVLQSELGVDIDVEETGSTFTSTSDTEVINKLIGKSYKKGLERALTDTIQMIKGSFALAVMTESSLIGARDPNGIRPLCLGKLEGGWMLASESCAIDAVGGTFVRDIQPGEIVIINEDGVLSFEFGERTAKRTCIFEYVYFARPDSIMDGISIQDARMKMGAVLARESGVPADVVIGVPDSGLGAAMGYAVEAGIPYAMGIVKNKYIGRTFIAPTQAERENLVFVKLNAMQSDVKGKRVVVIDDSIVRGTTCRRLIQILRRAGAKEVHFRVSSPPVKYPCYFGIDTPSRADLISAEHSTEEVCKAIGADSLAFISLDGMFEAMKELNEKKAALLYDYLDNQDYYTAPVEKASRSMMNVTFVTGNEDLDKKFPKEAEKAGLMNLKGHRSVGGMRASIYNAMPVEGVEKLIAEKKKVVRTIEELYSPTEYRVLHMRYIQYISLADIAEKMNKDYTWVTTVHGRAVKHVQDLLDRR